MDREPSHECFLVHGLGPDVLDVVVTRNYDPGRPDLSHLAELIFCRERLLLAYLLELTEHVCFILLEVIDQYCLLIGVPVPKLGLVLIEVIGVTGYRMAGFTRARRAVPPLVVLELADHGLWPDRAILV